MRSLVTKRPAAEKARSASTLVGGMAFKANKIRSKFGGRFPVASKLANWRFISGRISFEEEREAVEDFDFSIKKALSSSLLDFFAGGFSVSVSMSLQGKS